jgi:hypothetical protein
MSSITLQIPDELDELVAKYQERVPEILLRELRTLEDGAPPFDPTQYEGTDEIFAFLTGFPEPNGCH